MSYRALWTVFPERQQCVQPFGVRKRRRDSTSAVTRPVVHGQQGDKHLPGVPVRKKSKLNRNIDIGLRGPERRVLLRRGAARGGWLQMALTPFRDAWEDGEKGIAR